MTMPSPVVLVTGCSIGGAGSAICKAFEARGCTVYATSRKLETMQGLASESIRLLQMDVANDEHIVEEQGRIDILVNNAGTVAAGALIDNSMGHVKNVFDINTFSVVRLAKAVWRIVNIGSVVGDTPTPFNGLYAASKAALHSISDVLSMELRPFNIDVILVTPGGFTQPEDSLYKRYLPNILRRLNASQTMGPWSAEEFAEDVVSKSLMKRPPAHVMNGKSWQVFYVFKWLPRTWSLYLFQRMYLSKPEA
ncbi:oxidoreductase [Schizophyllum amplum]|uniref:Oxidoreductase n=1 Tax=Schizophyllum amplum TaxID=97359 RepID=A0A550CM74_9AGAR|nr:oxidoreductase [Auriculariopsis ampla]